MSTESGTMSPIASEVAHVAQEEQDHEQREDAAEDDLLAQVGERVGDELRLRRDDPDRDVGELGPELLHHAHHVAGDRHRVGARVLVDHEPDRGACRRAG